MTTFARHRPTAFGLASFAVLLAASGAARADDPPPMGTAPADAKALAAGPKAPGDAPTIGADADDGTTATVALGGLLLTGNSRTLALSGSGIVEGRSGANGFGGSLIGNYGQGAPPGSAIVATAENIQGRLRYDRYVIDQASVFLIVTGRHDRFQGIDARLNIDPGFKYMFVKLKSTALWGEAGYDFQYDVRRDDARAVLDANKQPVLDANGQPVLLDKTKVDHSARLFAGYRNAFNKEVTLSMGLEYLQSVIESTRWRLNFETLLAAKLAGGFALGLGVSARYDHDPLPSKEQLDTSTTVSLIYAYSNLPEKKEEPKCPAIVAPPAVTLPPPPVPEDAAPAPASTSTPTSTEPKQ